MYQGKYVFSQIMEPVVRYQFDQCVARYRGEYWVKNFSCWEQFLTLAFGQLSFRKSLRDIVVCLTAHREKLYHFGFRSPVARNTLAHANEERDWRIYRDYAALLIREAHVLYARDHPVDLGKTVSGKTVSGTLFRPPRISQYAREAKPLDGIPDPLG